MSVAEISCSTHAPQKVGTSSDPYTRVATKTPGITYRARRDGTRKYSVRHGAKWVPVEGGIAEARAVKADLESKKARGMQVVIPRKVTFSEVAEQWFEEAQHHPKKPLRSGTVKDYRAVLDSRLIPLFGARFVGSISPLEIRAMINSVYKEGLSESRAANICKPLAKALDYAVEQKLIHSSPWRQLAERPTCNARRDHRQWTMQDCEALISASESLDRRKDAHYPYTPIIRLLLSTGCRLGEALGAQWRDFDFAKASFTISRSFTRESTIGMPKTAASCREVTLDDATLAMLKAHRSRQVDRYGLVHASSESFVFAGRTGAPPTQSNFRRRGWEAAVAKAKLTDGPKITPHDARHARAGYLKALGIPIADVTDELGHSSSKITETIYGKGWSTEARRDRVRAAVASGGAS